MRLRPYRTLVEDPSFHLMVGRLVGASEMTAQLLKLGKLSASELIDVGERLDGVALWFLEAPPKKDRSPAEHRAEVAP